MVELSGVRIRPLTSGGVCPSFRPSSADAPAGPTCPFPPAKPAPPTPAASAMHPKSLGERPATPAPPNRAKTPKGPAGHVRSTTHAQPKGRTQREQAQPRKANLQRRPDSVRSPAGRLRTVQTIRAAPRPPNRTRSGRRAGAGADDTPRIIAAFWALTAPRSERRRHRRRISSPLESVGCANLGSVPRTEGPHQIGVQGGYGTTSNKVGNTSLPVGSCKLLTVMPSSRTA
jgi:hypothetical protein